MSEHTTESEAHVSIFISVHTTGSFHNHQNRFFFMHIHAHREDTIALVVSVSDQQEDLATLGSVQLRQTLAL